MNAFNSATQTIWYSFILQACFVPASKLLFLLFVQIESRCFTFKRASTDIESRSRKFAFHGPCHVSSRRLLLNLCNESVSIEQNTKTFSTSFPAYLSSQTVEFQRFLNTYLPCWFQRCLILSSARRFNASSNLHLCKFASSFCSKLSNW